MLRQEALSVLVLLFSAQTRIMGHSPRPSSFVVTQLASTAKFPEILAMIQAKNQVMIYIIFHLCVKSNKMAFLGPKLDFIFDTTFGSFAH